MKDKVNKGILSKWRAPRSLRVRTWGNDSPRRSWTARLSLRDVATALASFITIIANLAAKNQRTREIVSSSFIERPKNINSALFYRHLGVRTRTRYWRNIICTLEHKRSWTLVMTVLDFTQQSPRKIKTYNAANRSWAPRMWFAPTTLNAPRQTPSLSLFRQLNFEN